MKIKNYTVESKHGSGNNNISCLYEDSKKNIWAGTSGSGLFRYNINKDIISKLVKLDPHSVSTSLDGGIAKTHDYIRGVSGSFDKVMEYISLSLEANLPTTVITTISKINFNCFQFVVHIQIPSKFLFRNFI